MREIKFRGKRLDIGKWVYGSLVNNLYKRADNGEPVTHIVTTSNCDDCFNSCDSDEDFFTCEECFVRVDPATVGQYTELKDKAGQEIYEGDIVKAKDVNINNEPRHYICEIVWMPSGWISMKRKDYMGKEHYLNVNILETKVIGNIHDNPELLEVEK